jgi:hypothetical protein
MSMRPCAMYSWSGGGRTYNRIAHRLSQRFFVNESRPKRACLGMIGRGVSPQTIMGNRINLIVH